MTSFGKLKLDSNKNTIYIILYTTEYFKSGGY